LADISPEESINQITIFAEFSTFDMSEQLGGGQGYKGQQGINMKKKKKINLSKKKINLSLQVEEIKVYERRFRIFKKIQTTYGNLKSCLNGNYLVENKYEDNQPIHTRITAESLNKVIRAKIKNKISGIQFEIIEDEGRLDANGNRKQGYDFYYIIDKTHIIGEIQFGNWALLYYDLFKITQSMKRISGDILYIYIVVTGKLRTYLSEGIVEIDEPYSEFKTTFNSSKKKNIEVIILRLNLKSNQDVE